MSYVIETGELLAAFPQETLVHMYHSIKVANTDGRFDKQLMHLDRAIRINQVMG